MSWIKKYEWVFSSVSILLLAIIVFYISFKKLGNSLAISLFALFLILFIGWIADIIDRKLKKKQRNIWPRAILLLFAVISLTSFTSTIIFHGGLRDVLSFVIPYTLVILAVTWFRSQLHKE